MTDTANRTRIREVGTVFVPVADQDRALEFYLDKLGFEKRADFVYGGGSRWIEVAPPGAANTVSLVPPSEGESSGGDAAHCAFATEDIEATTRRSAPEASTWTRRSRALGSAGRGLSRPTPASAIPCRRSSSSATSTATAS